MMRVAYVCCDPGVPVFGYKGCSIHVQEVLRELLRCGAQVDLFAVRVGGTPPVGLQGVRVHSIDVVQTDDSESREHALLAANEIVRNLLECNGPYHLVYERYSLWFYAAMEYARNWLTPGILETNSPLIEEQALYRKLTNRDLAEQTTRRAMISAGAIVAVSQSVADYTRQQRLSTEEIHVIPNGVDLARFQREDQSVFPRVAGKFTVGFVGTLKPWHGVADLIDAFSILSKQNAAARLLIVRDGPERKRLEQQVAELAESAAGSVRFTGAVPPQEIPAMLGSMDVAVAPFLSQDNFYFSPLKIFEYMAAGLPTLASQIGQIPDIIQHGKTGLLFPPGEVQILADGLIHLSRNSELCASLGAAARSTAQAGFTWEMVVSRTLEIADRLRKKSSPIQKPHVQFGRELRTERSQV